MNKQILGLDNALADSFNGVSLFTLYSLNKLFNDTFEINNGRITKHINAYPIITSVDGKEV